MVKICQFKPKNFIFPDSVDDSLPTKPTLINVACYNRKAKISWRELKNDRSAEYYNIVYNIGTEYEYMGLIYRKNYEAGFPLYSEEIKMRPNLNYTFYVVAYNKHGSSKSEYSDVCENEPDVPYTNPTGVKFTSSDPTKLTIQWNPVPALEYNGPGFGYRIYWKRADTCDDWHDVTVEHYINKYEVRDQPTFAKYRIKVVSRNDLGNANVEPTEIDAYSGEGDPIEAPKNFRVTNIDDSTSQVTLEWDPAPAEAFNGFVNGYTIQFWNDFDGMKKAKIIFYKVMSEKLRTGELIQRKSAILQGLNRSYMNFARIRLVNKSGHLGPFSNVIEFKAFKGMVQSFDCFSLGSTAVLLQWSPPFELTDLIIGYNIYYEEIYGEAKRMRNVPVYSKCVQQTKISGLKPNTDYRFKIASTPACNQHENEDCIPVEGEL